MELRRKIMLEVTEGIHIEFDYVNWKGIFGHRKVKVGSVFLGSTEFHPEAQWLLSGTDVDKLEYRIFAMKDMSNVRKSN
jgi:hypothetical protein